MSMDAIVGYDAIGQIGAAAANTASVATITTPQALRAKIVGVSVSANAAPAAAVLVTISDSASGVLDQFYIPAGAFLPFGFNYNNPLRGSIGGTITGTVPALGAAVQSSITLRFFYDRP